MKNSIQRSFATLVGCFFLSTLAYSQAQYGSDIDGEEAFDRSGWSISMPDAKTVAVGAYLHEPGGQVRIYKWQNGGWTQRGNDIESVEQDSHFGEAVSMPDENTVAIGAPFSNATGNNSGKVQVYTWNGIEWAQKGADIEGEAANDQSGYSLSMPNANTLAIGARTADGTFSNSGHVRIYNWNGSAWVQKGSDIDGEALSDQSGHSVSMPDPNTVGIGANFNDGNGTNSGHVRVYSWNGSNWLQKGIDIDGEAAGDQFGRSVSMPNANTIAIGAPRNDDNGTDSGHTRIFSWNGSAWTQKGGDIIGETAGDQSGWSISMANPDKIAIGAPRNEEMGQNAGHVRLYAWNGIAWFQEGNDIDAEASSDQFGYSVSMPNDNTFSAGAWANDGSANVAGHVRTFSFLCGPGCDDGDTNTEDSCDPIQGCINYPTSPGSGEALVFDGVDDVVVVSPNNSDLNPTANGFTLSAWVQVNSSPNSFHHIMSKYGLGGLGGTQQDLYLFALFNSGFVRFDFRDETGVSQSCQSTFSIQDSKWHHVAVTIDPLQSSVNLFIDGIINVTQPLLVSGIVAPNNDLIIGGGENAGIPGYNSFFDGLIDEVRVWNTPLSSQEIRDHMCQKDLSSHPQLANLAAYYRFDDGTGSSTLQDISGNGNYGTLTNMDPTTDWVTSGAPIGDQSVQGYGTESVSVTDGTSMTVDNLTGSPDGVHVYRVNEAPNDVTVPSSYSALETSEYYGVHLVGGTNPSYSATFDYTGNANIDGQANESAALLASRSNNAAGSFENIATQTLDASANTIIAPNQTGTEYIPGFNQIVDTDGDGDPDSSDPCPNNAFAFPDDCGTCVGGDTGLDPCASADFVLSTESPSVTQCDEFSVLVSVETDDTYNTVEAILSFDPNELQVIDVTKPDTSDLVAFDPSYPFNQGGQLTEDNTNGVVGYFAATSTDLNADVDFIRIFFEVVGNGGTTSISPILTGFPRSRIAVSEFINGVPLATDILNEAIDLELNLSPDTELPTFDCVMNSSRDNDAGTCAYTVQGTEFDPTNVLDNCGILSVENDINNTASLAGVVLTDGTVVTWTVTDENNNSDQCSFTVTVNDVDDPEAVCQNFTVGLDASGNAAIIPQDIDNGSTDNCGIDNLALDIMSFDCGDVGQNTVTLTVTDEAGNSDQCTATVTVEDNVAPMVTCQDVTVQLDANGNATITAGEVVASSSDNCGIASSSVNPSSFDCSNVGANTVTVTVTDVNGNTNTCTATVTVEDNIAPEALCVGTLEVELNAFGTATITANDIDNGSNDACGIQSLSIDRTGFDCNDIAAPAGPALIITGVCDGDLSGGLPKAIELYVVEDISDLSQYGLGAAFNGNGSNGEDFEFSGSANAGDFIYVSTETTQFSSYFGVSPDFTNNVANINGNDAIELFENGTVIDVFGDINTNGSGEPWEYLDGWAYRVDQTGPDGSSFTLGNWTFSGPNALDGETSNATASTPFPIGTYTPAATSSGIAVTLTVTDNNGNTSTCTSEVTVVESGGPQALCNIFTIQLDENGMASIDVDDVDDASNAPCGIADRSIDITDFTCADLGPNNVVLTVTDVNGATSTCTAVVTVEDVTPPTAQCTDITVQLDETGNATITAEDIDNNSTDNCAIASRTIDIDSFTCADVGSPVTVTLTVQDGSGLTSTCTATVTVEDNVAPDAICATGLEVVLDASGNGTLTAAQVDGGSTDACGIASVSIDKENFNCNDVSLPGGTPSFAMIITGVIDGPLSGGTPKAVELYVAQDIADLSLYGIGSANNGGGTDGEEFTLSGSALAGSYIYVASESPNFASFFGFSPDFVSSAAGINGDDAVELFFNSSVIDVFGDINTDGTGEPWDHVDGWAYRSSNNEPSGSTFDLASWTFSGTGALNGESDNATASAPFPIGTYGFEALSTTEVTLTVTDNSGNTSTCTTNVIVTDNIAPTAICTSDAITVELDAMGNGSLNAAIIDGGSTDNCSIATIEVSPSSFTCAEVGTQTVTLTVTDQSGNSSTCTKDITVADNFDPVAICQNITVQLDASGNATITAAQVDDGSSDACGIASLAIDNDSFDCSNVGENFVILTVTDNNGNQSACGAMVTVEDDVAPTAVCQNITVQLDATGNTSIVAADIDNGSMDACGIASLAIDVNSFDCSNVGANTVELTVTDNNGNVSTCNATVTVEDNVTPTAVCQDITIDLDANGNVSIVAADVDGGSTDACGIASIGIDIDSFDCSNLGPNTVTLTVTDNNNNTNTCTAIVTVQDVTPPTIVCPDDIVVSNDPGSCGAIVNWVQPTGTDNCSLASLSGDNLPGSFFPIGTTTVNYLVTDIVGLEGSCSFTVTVEDTEAPTISCIGNTTVTVNQTNGTYLASGGEFDPTVSDNCPGTTATHNADGALSPQMGPSDTSLDGWEFPVGTTTIIYTATDASGNEVTCTFEITVENAVINGDVTLNGACLPLDMTVTVYETGTPSLNPILVATFTNVEIDTDGSFEIDAVGVVPGNYDIYLKPENYLARRVADVAVSGSDTGIDITNMVPGDISTVEDNRINGDDISLILNAYNTALDSGDGNPDPLYNPDANINCDGFVDALDLSLIIFFFPSEGDSPLLPE